MITFSRGLTYVIDTPWKPVAELLCLITTPFVRLMALIQGVKVDNGAKFYGRPIFLRSRGSVISIGKNFENRNIFWTNPLGINRRSLFCTWSNQASIIIGDDVGMSGTVIVATDRIEIGDETIIGPNTTIIDSDFHPIKPLQRRHAKNDIKSRPVKIGKNVFIGMGVTILKGVTIGDNSIVGAGEVVDKSVPPDSIIFKGVIRLFKE